MKRLVTCAALLVALVLVLSGCAGVPTSSRPQVVGRVSGAEQSPNAAITPTPGADQRTTVLDFLENNASTDQHHTGARAFLTPDAANRWVDSTVTIIDDREQVGQYDPATGSVTVIGYPLATVSPDGIYEPNLAAQSQAQKYVYGLRKLDGQWRISSLSNGALVTVSQFRSVYRAVSLYFYDPNQTYLVQDERYTGLANPDQLASWILTELVTGPRDELQNSVFTEIPSQVEARSVNVTVGATIDVTIPGAAGVGPPTLALLAAQLAYSLSAVSDTVPIRLIDGRPLTVASLGRPTFTEADFPSVASAPQSATLYYLHSGSLVNSAGSPIPGKLGDGAYSLTSAAVADLNNDTTLQVAGTAVQGRSERLWVGTSTQGLKPTSVVGHLTRPTWAPRRNEVWIGSGQTIWGVRPGSAPFRVNVQLESASGFQGTVQALRFSPDGVRIAMVLATADGNTQVWIGCVERSGTSVSVVGLEPITPEGVQMIDVAWNGPLTLQAVGRVGTADDGNLYRFQVDGSYLSSDTISGLPSVPDSMTVSFGAPVWASADGTVWTQSGAGDGWQSPTASGETSGTTPIYQE